MSGRSGAGTGSGPGRPAVRGVAGCVASGRAPAAPNLWQLWRRCAEAYRFKDWMHRELKDGGYLQRYLEHEKATSARRMRAVARAYHRVARRPGRTEDLRLRAVVPLREFIRWRKTDPHFWEDDVNLKSWKRDNPDAVVLT